MNQENGLPDNILYQRVNDLAEHGTPGLEAGVRVKLDEQGLELLCEHEVEAEELERGVDVRLELLDG
jgi:hypothetical protein